MSLSDKRAKADWNERARSDDFRWLDTRASTWEEFEALGADVVELLLADARPFLTPGGRALEIGCGPGRLLPSMANYFREVWATDVSAEMIELARCRVGHVAGVRLLETSGSDLDDVPSEYFDFCYSAFALEMIGDPSIVTKYIEEGHRVLKPGGLFKFQVRGLYPGNPFRSYYEQRRDTWFGAQFTMAEIVRLTEAAGFEVLAAYHARDLARPHEDGNLSAEHRIWVVARKGNGMDEWEGMCWRGGRALAKLTSPGDQVLLVPGKMEDLLGAAAGGTLRFNWFDSPTDDAEAIATFETLRSQGGRYLFLSKFGFWWIEYYVSFFEYLDQRYRRCEQTADYVIFDLE